MGTGSIGLFSLKGCNLVRNSLCQEMGARFPKAAGGSSHILVADARPVAVGAFLILCALGIDRSRDAIILLLPSEAQVLGCSLGEI
jgi:hypothetical protein